MSNTSTTPNTQVVDTTTTNTTANTGSTQPVPTPEPVDGVRQRAHSTGS